MYIRARLVTWALLISCSQPLAAQPAVPLIAHDPYFSVWSMRDRLTDDWPRHWSGALFGMSGVVRIDGQSYRWCGVLPGDIPTATQARREFTPTRTAFVFSVGGVDLRVTFYTPIEPGRDLSQLSRSVSAMLFESTATDAKPHAVQVYFDLTGEWCSDTSSDRVTWSRLRAGELSVVCMGTADQPVLASGGDRRTIDWGRVFLAVSERSEKHAAASDVAIGGHERSRSHFVATGRVLEQDDARVPRAVNDDWPVLAASIDFGNIDPSGATGASAHVLIGYDPVRSVELFERPLRPLWQVGGSGMTDAMLALQRALDLPEPQYRDAETQFVESATRVGGSEYAKLVSLAYRQVLAGHSIVADWDGTPLMFSKENTSNGCIATIDVIYPASPFYLYHDPEMLKASLRPLLQYAASPRWKFPFAPHDLGTFPKANGQVYGGGEQSEENQMPVEESGNMLIMLAAIAQIDGNAEFSKPYLPMLERWANYLRDNGGDPVNQLCTDDFAGHLARNANLSAKSCVALGAYAALLAKTDDKDGAARWRKVAEEAARRWIDMAGASGDGPSVLVFGGAADKPTWSQKYNLVWDRVLGLGLFPDSIFDAELAWYRKQLKKYGLPLDSRMTYTKLDWTCWSACLTRRRADFDAIMRPTYDWINASPPPSRVPMSDWYETTDGTTKGMYARTVVGGLWMPLLMEKLGIGWRE